MVKEKHFIVVRTRKFRVHPSLKSAKAEARRLSEKEKDTFLTLEVKDVAFPVPI